MANLYDRAIKKITGVVRGYFFQLDDKGFIHFQKLSTKEPAFSGWKTHLSVNPAHVSSATDIVMGIYRKYGGILFKVTDKATTVKFGNPAAPSAQVGKMFTLYDAGEKHWSKIIREIEGRFQKAGIKPGPPVVEDTLIPGSKFAFRRNDRGADGKYLDARDAKKINPKNPANPYGHHDPLKDFHLADVAKRGPFMTWLDKIMSHFGTGAPKQAVASPAAPAPKPAAMPVSGRVQAKPLGSGASTLGKSKYVDLDAPPDVPSRAGASSPPKIALDAPPPRVAARAGTGPRALALDEAGRKGATRIRPGGFFPKILQRIPLPRF